jgi:hypothetical protein
MKQPQGKFRGVPAVGFIIGAMLLWGGLQSSLGVVDLDAAAGRDLTFSEYNPTNLSLVVQIHAGRLFTDYERRGFFRIGLLPVPVAEKVQIQIQATECLTTALWMLQDWKHPATGFRRLEFRDLQISLLGEGRPRLCAAGARIGRNGALELSDVLVTGLSGQKISIARGILQVTGNETGRFSWKADDRPQQLFPFKTN